MFLPTPHSNGVVGWRIRQIFVRDVSLLSILPVEGYEVTPSFLAEAGPGVKTDTNPTSSSDVRVGE